MLRYMAVRLWAGLRFQQPPGKPNRAKELTYFVNTHTGKFVSANSGFSKTTTEQQIIGWERPYIISSIESENAARPITDTVTKKVRLSHNSRAGINRAIGAEVRSAVEHAMGTKWVSNHTLLANASDALSALAAPKADGSGN
ncbi:hypothetical protein [Actibacterium pelagium]|nr:hypothetical protein [Actibacterium pelagium]